MGNVLVIGGVDYSKHIERQGMTWTRNDLDTDKTVRTKDGKIRRDKIGTKRKLTFKLIHMTRQQLAALDDALSETFYSATYMDLHGVQTRRFYTSEFTSTLESLYSADGEWGEAEFNMIEE
jgi:hypothetical protein